MAIKRSQLVWYKVGNDRKLGIPAKSNILNDLVPDMSGAQNRDGDVRYRSLVVLNNHPTQSLTAAKFYFRILDTGGAIYRLALDQLGPVASTAVIVSDVSDRPTSYSSAYTSFATGLALPAALGPMQAVGLWVQRSGASGAARYPERNIIVLSGTTPA